MELWLLALIALALIPTVRLFMADGCREAPEPTGTHPLDVAVTANGRYSSAQCPDVEAAVEITAGRVEVHPPSGDPPYPSADVPRGGLHPPGARFDVDESMFTGAESPYRWTAHCTVDYECTDGGGSGSGLVGRGTLTHVHTWFWNATGPNPVTFVLRINEIPPDEPREPGTVVPAPPYDHCDYEWELVA